MSDYLGPYLLGPNDTPENGIYCGDARELAKAIPDESVDLIFTDPVYWQIDDYRWLGQTAARVLQSQGEMLTYYGQYYFAETVMALHPHIKVAWPLTEKKVGGSAWIYAYSMSSEVKSLLWCVKMVDTALHRIDHYYKPPMGSNANHKWHKSAQAAARWMGHYSEQNAMIFDPFCGGGSILAASKMLGRRYLAFEIDPATCELARERVRMTQPPLFVPQEEQIEMDMDT